MTEQHLINAFGRESQANMRYLHFADQAGKENLPNTARLFRAIAYSESVQADSHYLELRHLEGGFIVNSMAAFGPGNTKKNLKLAIMGENFVITEMYPAYIEAAKFQEEKGAERTFTWAYLTEKIHKQLFEKTKEAIDRNNDIEPKPIQVCKVCGYTREGEVPNKCPQCKATKEYFITFK